MKPRASQPFPPPESQDGVKRCPCRAGFRAFTVLELLLAVSLLSLIVFALYSMFDQTQRALRANLTQVDVQEGGRAAMELMTRELEQMSATQLAGCTNLFVGAYPTNAQVIQPLLVSNSYRTNIREQFFFMTRLSKDWIGTGYRVLFASNGVGTLDRISIATNVSKLTSNNLINAFFTTSLTNFQRVTDGVIHLRLLPYDAQGRLQVDGSAGFRILKADNTAALIGDLPLYFYYTNSAIPSYLELELGVIEPQTLQQLKSMPNPTAALTFLQLQASKVHLFRRRIPIRTALK